MAIKVNKDGTEQGGLIDDNVVQPFRLEKTNVRGRMVRMGSVLKDILARHDYPAPVSALLSEVVTLGLMLSAMLKYDGIFTLQIKGDGPISTLVADVTNQGDIRAYAGFDEDAVKKLAKRKQDIEHNYYHLLGKGYVAFTVDHHGDVEHRYQGIVELTGESIVDAVSHYLTQSEQIKTDFKVAVHPQDTQWRAGGIMIQHMPSSDAGVVSHVENEDADAWDRASILLQSCTEEELLSPLNHSADILYRLFHEDGVRVYPPTPVKQVCRCSHDKVVGIIKSMAQEEMEKTCKEQGKIEIKCEFCSKEYIFSMDDLQAIYAEDDRT